MHFIVVVAGWPGPWGSERDRGMKAGGCCSKGMCDRSMWRVKLAGHMHDYAVAARRPHGIMEVEGEFGAAKGRHK